MSAAELMRAVEQAKDALEVAEQDKASFVLDLLIQADSVIAQLAAVGEYYALVLVSEIVENVKAAEPAAPLHAVRHRALLLEPLGIALADPRLAWQVTEEEQSWTRDWRGKYVPAGAPLIGLQIASFPTKAQRDWPVSCFQELIGGIIATQSEARFVLLGDAAAAKKAAPLLAAYPREVALAAGRLTLRQSAALMAGLDLYIGVDTGPTHIAGALGIPMVALYHSAYPGRNLAPLQHPACVVLEHPQTGKSAATTASMADIPVVVVLQAATDVLARGLRR